MASPELCCSVAQGRWDCLLVMSTFWAGATSYLRKSVQVSVEDTVLSEQVHGVLWSNLLKVTVVLRFRGFLRR